VQSTRATALTGALRVVRVRAEELREALAPAVAQPRRRAVRIVIEGRSARARGRHRQNGVVLAGGGARSTASPSC